MDLCSKSETNAIQIASEHDFRIIMHNNNEMKLSLFCQNHDLLRAPLRALKLCQKDNIRTDGPAVLIY